MTTADNNEDPRRQVNIKMNLNALLIHPAIEPGVIDNDMLTRAILAEGPTEETGRLFAEEGIVFNDVKALRLEFLNILRIDHLWMLPSLTKLCIAHNHIEKIENLDRLPNLNELDLSFNKIEVIENVELLVNLEILTLFHNNIKKLENMDTLEKLLVFSIGDNLIEDYKEVAYLRRFRFLRTVSFKGNPCCDDPMTYHFCKAALTKVTYLDYKIVTDKDREPGESIFRGLLHKLDAIDEKREKERVAKEEYEARVQFYGMSFVEYLSGPEFLETMFNQDPDGLLLLKVGGELLTFYEVYTNQYVGAMAGLVEFAQSAYKDRENEIKLYKDLVDNALEASVACSKAAIIEYETAKAPLVSTVQDLNAKFANKKATLEELEPQFADLCEVFNKIIYQCWKKLMTYELNLFEQCEESRVQFSVNMSEKINKLMEVSRNAFGVWREYESNWSMRQFETLNKLMTNKKIPVDASPDLLEILTDRDVMLNAIAASTDNHMRFIDEREDLLMTRANKWRMELVEGTNENEIKRNRDRILEINYYIDNQRWEWADMQSTISDAIDTETAALLGGEL